MTQEDKFPNTNWYREILIIFLVIGIIIYFLKTLADNQQERIKLLRLDRQYNQTYNNTNIV